MTDEPIYPIVTNVAQAVEASCSQTKSFSYEVSNIGTEVLTSLRFNVVVGNNTKEFDWNGSLPSGDKTIMNFDMALPFGTNVGTMMIVEANGQSFDYQTNFIADCFEWVEYLTEDETATLKVYIVQDQFGEQITWDIINSTGEIIGEGGPYQHLIGSGSTQPNVQTIHDVPVNECYLFRIFDSNNNGICCNYGNGYFYVKDGHGNVIFGGEGNGDFGEMASQLFSIYNPSMIEVVTGDPRVMGCNEAIFVGTLNGVADGVGFEYYKLVDHVVNEVEGELNGHVFTASVDNLEANTMYAVTAYAILADGSKVYGDDVHFHTWTEGVSELDNTLKMYPNPANDYLKVEGKMTSVEVFNTMGQCVFSKQVDGSEVQINLSGMNNGVYYLRVSYDGETAVRKFSVIR
jgi:hypothetical protein